MLERRGAVADRPFPVPSRHAEHRASQGFFHQGGRPSVAAFATSPVWVPRVQRSTRMLMGLTLLAAAFYGAFTLHPANRGDLGAYLALVVADGLLLLNAFAMWATSLTGERDRPEPIEVIEFRRALLSGTAAPTIDVLIPVFGEPLEVIEATAVAARDMHLAHRTWVCDDGRSDAVRDLCARIGVSYLRRHDDAGAKAGNVNRALGRTDGEYVVLFDADHVPHPDFLVVCLPQLVDPDVAFVQTPQWYRNHDGNFVANAAAESQRLFYELISPGKNRFNAAFHVGTNAVFRRRALEDVGGFFEGSQSEDIWTSVRLHQRGWKSIYLPQVVAHGLSPTTIDAYMRQQARWASGSFEILLRANPLRMRGLTFDQRLQYSTPPLHFLLGFANLWFLLLPPLFLLFGVTPLAVDSTTWLFRFLPFYVLTQLVLWMQAGGLKLNPVTLSIATAPVHVRAFFTVLLRRNSAWRATNNATKPLILPTILPQASLALLNVTAIVVGVTATGDPTGTIISIGLCALHTVLLGRVVAQAVTDRYAGRAATAASIDLRADLGAGGERAAVPPQEALAVGARPAQELVIDLRGLAETASHTAPATHTGPATHTDTDVESMAAPLDLPPPAPPAPAVPPAPRRTT